MFQCEVAVYLPLRVVGQNEQLHFRIATYDFDPGLQVGDEVRFLDVSLTRKYENGQVVEDKGPRFTFSGQVRKRRTIIQPQAPRDLFFLLLEVEVADKERFPEMMKYLKETFPGKYEDYPLSQKND